MEVNITTHPEFERQFRRFVKKYRSLVDDYAKLLGRLRDNPFQGNDLGGHLHKVRLGVNSKGRGKSGGMRVITYTVEQLSDETIEITLLYIYDKSEMSAVSPQFLRWLLSQENI